MTLCDSDVSTHIMEILHRLGAKANTTGFFYTAYALQLTVAQPSRLALVTKWVYPDVAAQYQTSWDAVERGIRNTITGAWGCHCDLMLELFPDEIRPTASQFLLILTRYLLSDRAA